MTTYKSFIGGADMNFWDGVSRTFNRKTSTGGNLSLNRVGALCNVLDVYGSGTAYTDTTISTALGRIGSNNVGLLLLPGTWNIQNNLTIPANTPLFLMPGAVVTVASGKTLTVNSQPEAGPYQVFAGDGSITFATGLHLMSSWFASFSTAITKISTAVVTLEVTESETISADTTVAATTVLLWLAANELTVAAAKTLTLNGPIVAPPYQIFDGTGTLAGTPTALKDSNWVSGTVTDSATWAETFSGTPTFSGASTFSGVATFSATPKTDAIAEKTAAAGVTIDSFKIKDNAPDPTSWPSFRAHMASQQAIGSTAATKVEFDTEDFDTNSDYDKDTNYRFTPTVAGKYIVSGQIQVASCDSGTFSVYINNNGTQEIKYTDYSSNATRVLPLAPVIITMNGSTNFFEIYVQSSTDTSYTVEQAAAYTYFCASRIA